MTVVRLDNDQLFLHSPVTLTDEVARALAALGQVSFVIPASGLHGHLFMKQYALAYPWAELFAAPGLRAISRAADRFAGKPAPSTCARPAG